MKSPNPRADAWKYPARLIAGATADWCKAEGLRQTRQYIWLDVLCWNQHGRLVDPVGEWIPRVQAIGHQLTMLHPWNNPIYVTRGWCVFELWYAITQSRNCALSIILAPEDRAAFHARVNADGTDADAIDEALAIVNSKDAEAYSETDLDTIRGKIETLAGGFATLDNLIKTHLRQWFVSQGGVKVVARRSQATLHADRARLRSAPTVRRVERVPVARFSTSTSTSTAAAAATAVVTAAGAPAVSMFVSNPAYEAAIETPWPPIVPVARPFAPIPTSATVGRSRSSGPGTISEAVRLQGTAEDGTADTPYEDELPAASVGALSSVSRSISRDRRDDGADGGYMEVEGTPLPPPGRQESDVSLIADAGLGRQTSDVSLIADLGIIPGRLASLSEL